MNKFRVKNSHFSKRLKYLRRSIGCKSAEAFAERFNYSVDTYKEWESKGHMPVLDSLINLSRIFDVSVDYLLGESNYLHVENEEIQEITGLSEKSIEVLRYIKETETPNYIHDLDNTEEYNSTIIDMLNELLEDSYESVCEAKRKKEKDEGVYPLDSIFTQFYGYIYSDSVKINNRAHDFLTFNIGYQDQICSGGELYRELLLQRIIRYLDYLRSKRVCLTKNDIKIVFSDNGFDISESTPEKDYFTKDGKNYYVESNHGTHDYVLKKCNASYDVEREIAFNEEPDKKQTKALLVDAINKILNDN